MLTSGFQRPTRWSPTRKVAPLAGSCGIELGIVVVGRGVEVERDEAMAVATVHLELAPVEVVGVPITAFGDFHHAIGGHGGNGGLDGFEVRRGRKREIRQARWEGLLGLCEGPATGPNGLSQSADTVANKAKETPGGGAKAGQKM